MSAQQVQRLQALLHTVQENRKRPRAVAEVAAPAPSESSFGEMDMDPDFGAPAAAPAPVAAPMAARAEPAMRTPVGHPAPAPRPAAPERRPAIVEEHVRVPERVSMPGGQRQPMAARQPEPRPNPAPARPTSPGATPLEMALEGEVARVARGAEPVTPSPAAGRVLADPSPPEPTRAIAQAVSKHPPVTGHTFGELLRRSLSLRAR